MNPSSDPKKDLVLTEVAKQIRSATKSLNPKKGSQFQINLEKDFGLWTLDKPGSYDETGARPGTQVTTGLPIEGTYCHCPWMLHS